MLRHFSFLAIFALFCSGFLEAKQLTCNVNAKCALVMNADTGKVIFAKNAHEQHYPASTTKIAIGLYTIKHYSHLMNQQIRCSQEALKCVTEAEKSKGNYSKYPSYVLETDMSHMGLKVGEVMSFRDLLLGMLVVSADDASNVIAETAGNGSIERFMAGVNNYVAQLGLKNTKFFNPHGLHHPEHVSTAYDIALLMHEAAKDPKFVEIVKMARFERPHTNKQKAVTLHQTNKLVVKTSEHYYPYVIGGKTGYHRRARHNLASVAEKDGRRLIAVVLNVEKRAHVFQDSKKLFETAFAEQKVSKMLLPHGAQSFQCEVRGASSASKLLSTYTTEALTHAYYPSEEAEVRCQLVWEELSAPIKKGDRVGYVQLLVDGVTARKLPLLAGNAVEMSWSEKLRRRSSTLFAKPVFLIALGATAIFGLYLLLTRRRAL